MSTQRRSPVLVVSTLAIFALVFLSCLFLAHGNGNSGGPVHHAASLIPSANPAHRDDHSIYGSRTHEDEATELEIIRARAVKNNGVIVSEDEESAERTIDQRERAKKQCEPQPYNFGDKSTYCGADFFTADTYPQPDPVSGSTWQLVGVQLVTRHGDRTPVNILPYYDVAYPFCDTTASLGFYQQDSTSVPTLVQGSKTHQRQHHPRRPTRQPHLTDQPEGRRLERIPYLTTQSLSNPYANELWQGNCMTGQLTSHGVSQLESFGAAFRSIYVDTLGFLPSSYSRANTSFYLRTTDVWRTRQSAESFLTGLWPSSSLDDDVIPFHSFPEEIETMYANSLACDALANIQTQQYSEAPWVAHLQVPEIWSQFDTILGVGGLPDWHHGFDHYVDNFRTRQCHNLPLPCNPNNLTQCITQEVADFVYDQGDWEYQYLMNESPLATQLAQVGISAFMSVIRDVIVAKVSGNASISTIGDPDFTYYSGHDTTMGAILGALNITGFSWPPYASNMQFELWQQLPAGTYFVRVLYNGVILPLYAAGCCDDLCPSDQFIEYLDSMIPENLVEICAGDGVRKQIHIATH